MSAAYPNLTIQRVVGADQDKLRAIAKLAQFDNGDLLVTYFFRSSRSEKAHWYTYAIAGDRITSSTLKGLLVLWRLRQ